MARVKDGRNDEKNASYTGGSRSGGGDGHSTPWASGSDAAYIKPKLVPDYELHGRDDSGGPEYDPYSAQFSDGGFVQGPKAHLSAKGGKDDPMESDQQSERPRTGRRAVGSADTDAPASSKRRARE
jgi:hypothetical protein